MTTFKDLGLPSNILNSLEKIGFTTPTPIQEQAIPVAMQGKDVLGSAQTGTGKTASFILPILAHLWENQDSCAMVLLPTRELSMQVCEATRQMMAGDSSIRIAQLIGGDSMLKQISALSKHPRLIIGTPGRINDHLKRKNLKLKMTDFFVLDETDRMLDMGFGMQIDAIAKFLPQQRQTLMFSATMPKNIMEMAKKYLNEPVRISIGDTNAVAKNVRQELVKTSDANKYPNLLTQITDKQGSTIIFVKTKVSADKLAVKLNKDNLSADAIHGDLRQSKRQAIISSFRSQKFKILVATDIAARGLDIPHIENVVNYDLPQCPEDYIHRIGRTARAGASGMAINLLTPQDTRRWKDIHKLLHPNEKMPDFGDEREGSSKRRSSRSRSSFDNTSSDSSKSRGMRTRSSSKSMSKFDDQSGARKQSRKAEKKSKSFSEQIRTKKFSDFPMENNFFEEYSAPAYKNSKKSDAALKPRDDFKGSRKSSDYGKRTVSKSWDKDGSSSDFKGSRKSDGFKKTFNNDKRSDSRKSFDDMSGSDFKKSKKSYGFSKPENGEGKFGGKRPSGKGGKFTSMINARKAKRTTVRKGR